MNAHFSAARLFGSVFMVFGVAAVLPAQVTINLNAGVLYSAPGVPLADGRLIQLIVSTSDANFSAPTSTSFVSGDDVVLFSFALDSSTSGTAGALTAVLNLSSLGSVPGLTAGDALVLRWFDLNYGASTPTAGVAYGEYRSTIAIDDSMVWSMLGDFSTIDLNLLTLAAGSTTHTDESVGLASQTVSAIPEPAGAAVLAAVCTLAFIYYRRRSS